MVQVAVVNFTTPATTGNFDVTSPAITETWECAILLYSRMTTEDTNEDTGFLGIGFVSAEGDEGGSRNDGGRVINFRGSAVTTVPATFTSNYVTGTAKSIVSTDAVGASVTVDAQFVAVIAGGFRMNLTTATAGQQIRCTAILFAGISRSSVGTATSLTASSTHEDVGHTTVGLFQPDLIICGGADGSLALNAADGTPNLGLAVRYPALAQVAHYINVDNSTEPSDGDGFIRSDSCSCAFNGAVRTQERVVISSFDSTGFNHQATGSQHSFQYLAIKFSDTARVRIACANMSISASTGLQSFNSFGFDPDVVLGMSSLLDAVDTDISGTKASSAGYFVTGPKGSYAYSAHEENGQTITAGNPANAHSRQGPHGLLTLTHLGAVAQQADWAGSTGAGGFLLNFSTATAGFMTALGIQVIPSPPRGKAPKKGVAGKGKKQRRLWIRGARHATAHPAASGSSAGSRTIRHARKTAAPHGKHSVLGIGAVLREIGRFRRAALARVRFVPPPFQETETPPIAAILEQPPTGRITQPGLLRGRVVPSGAFDQLGNLPAPGLVRGRIVGATLKQAERDL